MQVRVRSRLPLPLRTRVLVAQVLVAVVASLHLLDSRALLVLVPGIRVVLAVVRYLVVNRVVVRMPLVDLVHLHPCSAKPKDSNPQHLERHRVKRHLPLVNNHNRRNKEAEARLALSGTRKINLNPRSGVYEVNHNLHLGARRVNHNQPSAQLQVSHNPPLEAVGHLAAVGRTPSIRSMPDLRLQPSHRCQLPKIHSMLAQIKTKVHS